MNENQAEELLKVINSTDDPDSLRSMIRIQAARESIFMAGVQRSFKVALSKAQPEELATIENLRKEIEKHLSEGNLWLTLTVMRKTLGVSGVPEETGLWPDDYDGTFRT